MVTPGLAIHLAHADRVAVGRRVLVAGTGPLLLAAAEAILATGGGVVALAELNEPYALRRISPAALTAPGKAFELARLLLALRRHRVPVLQGVRLRSAQGGGGVTSVTLEPIAGGPAIDLDVDAVCSGTGFLPNLELARLLGCGCEHDASSGQLRVAADEAGATDVDGVWVTGELLGPAGAAAAEARGRVTAAAVLRRLGRPSPRFRPLLSRWRARGASAAMGFAFRELYPPPTVLEREVEDEVTVCRCEAVPAWRIRRAARGGGDPNSVKALTRAGMGLCQGRWCGHVVDAMTGGDPFTPRPPIRPVPAAWFGPPDPG